jgi:DNA-binding response OmpR family regulator
VGNAALEGRFLVKSKILIIDDDVDSWRLLSTILQTHDFHPVWAADGMQAIAAARLHQPQAILLDLGMPGGDGLLVLERLKSNRLLSHIPVIVVTVRDRQEAEEQTRRLGAAAYLQKPIHDDTLMASLRTVLATSDEALEVGPDRSA